MICSPTGICQLVILIFAKAAKISSAKSGNLNCWRLSPAQISLYCFGVAIMITAESGALPTTTS